MKTLYLPAGLLLSAALLAGCSQGGPALADDPLAQYREQRLDWQACDASILGRNPAQYQKRFEVLGERLKCAEMRAPLDWNSPQKGDVSVTLIRTAAADASKRQGAIFFNPGGPGGDGLSFAPNYAYAWSQGDDSVATERGLKALQQQYDLVGFSPRGVGNSTRLYCGLNLMSVPYYAAASDRSDANVQKMIREGQLRAKACENNPIAPYINTDATVRDMDLARQLLGEKKLNYIGYSYGTWLGSWYAKRFPEQTGRMLLDGNMPWHDNMQVNWQTDPMAFTRAFTDVAAPYLARHAKVYGLSSDPQVIYQDTLKLSEPLQSAVRDNLSGMLYSTAAYPDMGLLLRVAMELDAKIQAKPKATDAELFAALQGMDFFGDEDANDLALGALQQLLAERRRLLNQTPKPVFLNESSGTMTAVMCNDTPWTKDLSYWRKLDDQNAQQYPLFGGDIISLSCIHWKGGPSVQKPAVPANMPPLLMLNNEYDPATPLEGAVDAMNSVPDARMILIDNEASHAAFPYGTDCVDLPIIQYFLEGSRPQNKTTVCQAWPLPGEDRVFNAGRDYLAGANGVRKQFGSQSAASRDVQAALEENRKTIEQNAALFMGHR